MESPSEDVEWIKNEVLVRLPDGTPITISKDIGGRVWTEPNRLVSKTARRSIPLKLPPTVEVGAIIETNDHYYEVIPKPKTAEHEGVYCKLIPRSDEPDEKRLGELMSQKKLLLKSI